MVDPLQICKILIIEDSPTALEIIQEGLSTAPFPVQFSVCKTGGEATDYLKSCFTFSGGMTEVVTEGFPDFIVLDMEMPEVHGLQILENIRGDERFKKVPILINTGSARIDYMFKSRSFENVQYLKKAPGNGDKIREIVIKHRNTPV